MIALILSWAAIFFILFSLGDMLLMLYNTLCKQQEQYNPLGKLFLGLALLVIPLSAWSLWLPSNHYFTLLVFVSAIVYWAFNSSRLLSSLRSMRQSIKRLNTCQLFAIFIFVLIIIVANLWVGGTYDSIEYYYQNIAWNEQYSIVPGLANLKTKFGFNSNTLLVSAIFTFSAIAGEALYTFQSLIVLSLGIWILFEVFTSKYEIKRVFILIAYALLYIAEIKSMSDTSTDILPNIITFYMLAQIILQKSIRKHLLFILVIPSLIITLKLSLVTLLVLSIYAVYLAYKENKKTSISFAVVVNLLIVGLWLTRNVIISGYLVFPMESIDIFSFDWKVPAQIAMDQKAWINEHAISHTWQTITQPMIVYINPAWANLLIVLIYVISLVTFSITSINLWIKRKSVSTDIIITYLTITLTILFCIIQAPSFRFISGVLTILVPLSVASFRFNKVRDKHISLIGITTTLCFLIMIGTWSGRRFYDKQNLIMERNGGTQGRPTSQVLYKPYPHFIYLDAISNISKDRHFQEYVINNNITLYTAPSDISYHKIPSIGQIYYDSAPTFSYKCVEARGTTVQDGFRTTKNCRD